MSVNIAYCPNCQAPMYDDDDTECQECGYSPNGRIINGQARIKNSPKVLKFRKTRFDEDT